MVENKDRLQKLISEAGIASRRKAEEMINEKRVKVNGHVAKLGDKANLYKDVVTVDGKRIQKADKLVYLMMNKPRGFVTTLNDELGRKCVASLVEREGVRLYPVGRLDRDSEGLLLMTNDGNFANKITHPSHEVPKTYRVTVRPQATEEQLDKMAQGVEIDGVKAIPAGIRVIKYEDDKSILEIIITEGRNREIRKMCEAVGLEVARLKRLAIGDLHVGMLAVGKYRHLSQEEVRDLLSYASAKKEINEDKRKRY